MLKKNIKYTALIQHQVKHKKTYPKIYTTLGVWYTKVPLEAQVAMKKSKFYLKKFQEYHG